MSLKLHKRLSSKKKKLLKPSVQADVLCNLGLEAFRTTPLDPASMLDISTWTLENQVTLELQDLPYAFLRQLWLLSPDARSPCFSSPSVDVENGLKSTEVIMNGAGGDQECAINPLDLVTAIFMSSNTFLQQEIVTRMVRCQFAVPLVLPNVDPEEACRFLLWPLRSVFSQWRCHSPDQNTYTVQGGNLASTPMPLVSCVRLGHSDISKSQVLNLMTDTMLSEMFLHKGMAWGQQPRRLANGLVEIGWYVPSEDPNTDSFPVPVVLANLRGDASAHVKSLTLLCQASSAVVVFCGNLREKEKEILSLCKNIASKLILVDVSDCDRRENSTVGFIEQNLEETTGLPKESVLKGKDVSLEDLANRLCDTLQVLVSDQLTHVTLEAAAQLASELDFSVDEGPVCRKAMVLAEQVLKDLDEGPAQYREKQLPLQGPLWSKLAEIEKDESKQKEANNDIDLECQNKKKEILVELSSYKITSAMKIFTDALFTKDKMERTYFLNWMELKLSEIQAKKKNLPQDVCNNLQMKNVNGTFQQATELENTIYDDQEDNDSFCTDSTFEDETNDGSALNTEPQDLQHQTPGTFENQTGVNPTCTKPEPSVLGLQHFLREMGLIYQLTHIRPGSGSHNVLRLPSLAVDLLLYGVPLEIMDGDASNIPMQWLGCVLADLKRRLPHEQFRTRVLTSLGLHSASNAEVLSAVFNLNFAQERKRCTRGIYMLALCVPNSLRNELGCDFLLLLDVEGLCCANDGRNSLIQDNEMATVATGLSDILIENISSRSGSKFESIFTVIVNALLRVRECASMPICQTVAQDENINTILQASQLRRVAKILQTDSEHRKRPNQPETTTVIGPWYNDSLCKPADPQYGNAIMTLKQRLIKALKECSSVSEASALPQFLVRLSAVWDAVKADLFAVSLQNTDIAMTFSILCTELSQWESNLMEHMERWLTEAFKKSFATKANILDATVQNDLLNELMDEARAKVRTEVDGIRSKLEAYWVKDHYLKMYSQTLKPVLLSNMDDLQEQVTEETIRRLVTVSKSHCFSTQLRTFRILLEKEQETKLCELIENSKSTQILQEDTKLEEEFESLWSKTMSQIDLRPSETEDITPTVIAILRQNLINRGLHKHIKTIEKIGQNQPKGFKVQDEYFVYHSRLKHMFNDNRKNLKLEAQQVACHMIEQYNQFVADKSNSLLDFSYDYITELLEIIDKTLKEKSMKIKSAFEVDLKVYLCGFACKDFQQLHDCYAKDKKLLACINATKTVSLAEFIYQFRKRDQGQRMAQAFILLAIKPIVLDYIYTPLGMHIVEEIQSKSPEYRSPSAFYQSLLEELVNNDHFESFLDFLLYYDSFRQKKIQEIVLAYLSESDALNKWRQQRLGDIVGKIASAVSQTGEGNNGGLCDIKPLLQRVYLTLEENRDIDISRASLDGPLFDITIDWDRFVTCVMESLAAMRLELSQDFSEPVDVVGLLKQLRTDPQDYLFERLKGCEIQCPACKAPCEVSDKEHDVHKVSLHRPEGVLPPDTCVVSCNTSNNSQNPSAISQDLHSLDPDKTFCSENSQSNIHMAYWRYVFARFNERFANEHKRSPAQIPEEWKKITQKEALDSLKEVLKTEQTQ